MRRTYTAYSYLLTDATVINSHPRPEGGGNAPFCCLPPAVYILKKKNFKKTSNEEEEASNLLAFVATDTSRSLGLETAWLHLSVVNITYAVVC